MPGAFLDSTLDRLADGALLGGLAVFYAINPDHQRAIDDDGGMSIAGLIACVPDVVYQSASRGARHRLQEGRDVAATWSWRVPLVGSSRVCSVLRSTDYCSNRHRGRS